MVLIIHPSRASGKTYTAIQNIKEIIENGGKVLYVRKAGQVLIDKNGYTPLPKKEGK